MYIYICCVYKYILVHTYIYVCTYTYTDTRIYTNSSLTAHAWMRRDMPDSCVCCKKWSLQPKIILNRNLPMCKCGLFASSDTVRNLGSSCPLHLNIRKILQIRTANSIACMWRRCLIFNRWPQVCLVRIMFGWLPTNSADRMRRNVS